jgi:hypothetical protein
MAAATAGDFARCIGANFGVLARSLVHFGAGGVGWLKTGIKLFWREPHECVGQRSHLHRAAASIPNHERVCIRWNTLVGLLSRVRVQLDRRFPLRKASMIWSVVTPGDLRVEAYEEMWNLVGVFGPTASV